jgi:hypothetical protein
VQLLMTLQRCKSCILIADDTCVYNCHALCSVHPQKAASSSNSSSSSSNTSDEKFVQMRGKSSSSSSSSSSAQQHKQSSQAMISLQSAGSFSDARKDRSKFISNLRPEGRKVC